MRLSAARFSGGSAACRRDHLLRPWNPRDHCKLCARHENERVAVARHLQLRRRKTQHGGAAMKIEEVMTSDVSYVRPDTSILEIARKMRDDDIGSVPVVENDRLIGMVTDRDIVIRVLAEGRTQSGTARDAMSPGILYCFDDESVEDVLDKMADQQIRRLPVLNRDKRLVGVVSLGDLSLAGKRKAAGEALQEISQPGH
jgi:CBS domain-containing protein